MGDPVTPATPSPGSNSMFGSTLGGAADRAELPASIPRQVGRFVVLRQVGQGGMGVVYAAYDEELDRKVAVKLLRASDPADGEARARILREAQAMARVAHPNVVSVYEVGEIDGQIFIAMEFVEGTTLRQWQQGRPWEEVLPTYLAAGEGLLAAHQAGLIHRDFKPDNVLIGADGRPRVADFGLARVGSAAEVTPAAATAGPPGSSGSSLTVAGTILGTPAYMSPEQHHGVPADARSDQWSFCVALFEALYHGLPFSGETLAEVAKSVGSGVVRAIPPTSPVPPPIKAILRRGLSVDAAARYPSMAELLDALSVDPRHDRAAAPGARLLITASIVLVLVGTTLLSRATGIGHSAQVVRTFRVGLVQLAILVCASLLMRRRLSWSPFHWGIVRATLIMLAQMAVLRWTAMRAGLDLRWILALDLLAFSAGLATMAWSYLPGVWASVALCTAASIGLALSPSFLAAAAQLAYPLATLLVIVLWLRAARAGKARPPSSRPGGSSSSTWKRISSQGPSPSPGRRFS